VRTLEQDLEAAEKFHGHLCHGMALGVRMARYGCRALGIEDPPGYRDLVVYVEMDRCASDAVSSVTGVTLGRRRLKWVDYGKMAATFVDLATDRAVRIAPLASAPWAGPDADPIEFWKGFAEDELFSCVPVIVDIPLEDRPGRPVRSAICADCGEKIMDGREVESGGRTLCRGCARGTYYMQPPVDASAGQEGD
jgi:formylmethanofuran dehydrogenase subunit E